MNSILFDEIVRRRTKMYLCSMDGAPIKIDMQKMAAAVQAYVRAKAIKFGTTIVYKEGLNLVEEDPRTGKKQIITDSK